jgi:hypothetical protein
MKLEDQMETVESAKTTKRFKGNVPKHEEIINLLDDE